MSDFKKNKWIMDIKYTKSLYYFGHPLRFAC